MIEIDIQSPLDCTVLSCCQAGAVETGKVVIELKSAVLEKHKAQLVSFKSQLDTIELAKGRLIDAMASANERVGFLQACVDNYQIVQSSAELSYQLGLNDTLHVDNAKKDVFTAQSAVIDAVLNALKVQKEKDDLDDQIAIAKGRYDKELTYVTDYQTLLTIKTPIACKFQPDIQVGMFAKHGRRLGRLTIQDAESLPKVPDDADVFEAPLDGVAVSVAKGGDVKAGDILMTLSSPMLDKLIAQAAAQQAYLAVLARPLSPQDGRIDAEISAINQKAKILSDAEANCEALLGIIDTQIKLRLADPTDAAKPLATLNSAKAALSDANLAAQTAQKQKDDLQAKVDAAKGKLDAETTYAKALTDLMTIRSPKTGKFTSSIAVGMFVKKGRKLGYVS